MFKITPEQIAMIRAVGDALRANPRPWDQLSQQEVAVVTSILRPVRGFTAEQKGFIKHWWLEVTDEQTDAINAELPANNRFEPRIDGDGKKWMSCDYMTDALENGRLAKILPLLKTLTLRHIAEDRWPIIDDKVP